MATYLLLWEEDHVMHGDAGYSKTRYTGRGEVPEWMIYAGSQHQFVCVCEGCDSFSASSDRAGMLKTKKKALRRPKRLKLRARAGLTDVVSPGAGNNWCRNQTEKC
jgi:hypothetical protein